MYFIGIVFDSSEIMFFVGRIVPAEPLALVLVLRERARM